jgi:CRISPR type IV-associated protein Csf3
MPTFSPLRIRAYLQCPILCDGYLPIDGILYSVHVRAHWGAEEMSLPNASVAPPGRRFSDLPHLPLKQIQSHTREWYYAASWAQWPAHTVPIQDAWSKRLDLSIATGLLDPHTKRVDPASGKYKAYRMPVFGFAALSVTWYVMGVQQPLVDLLRFVPFLGKKTSQGYGAVLSWEVTPCENDWSVTGPQGALMRAVPAAHGPRYAIRPPYHNPKQQVPCALPPVIMG